MGVITALFSFVGKVPLATERLKRNVSGKENNSVFLLITVTAISLIPKFFLLLSFFLLHYISLD